MNEIIHIIINLVKKLLENYTKEPVKQYYDDVYKPKKSQGAYDTVRKDGQDHHYNNDRLIIDTLYDKRIIDKCIAMVHYAGSESHEATSGYLVKHSKANCNWTVGKGGLVWRHLPDPGNPSYTQYIAPNIKGGFIDHTGKWRRDLNNITCSFEVNGIRTTIFSEDQYRAVAVRLWWMNEYFHNYRIWFTVGHEQTNPGQRNDPGPNWDWQKLFCKYLGVEKDFYKTYLSYLAETSSHSTIGNTEATNRQLHYVREATERITTDLINKPKSFGLRGI